MGIVAWLDSPVGVLRMSPFLFFLGIDWSNTRHAVCFLDATTRKRVERFFPHTADGNAALIRWLHDLVEDIGQVAAAIERADHPLVDALLEAGVPCFAINPKQADRFRECFFPGGAKDDRRDARSLAEALRTNLEIFLKLEVPDPIAVAIREAYRRFDAQTEDLGRLSNRLWEDVQRLAPEFLSACGSANTPFFWDLLELAADPAAAAKLRPAAIAKLLKAHRKRKLTKGELLALVRAPRLTRAPGVTESVLRNIRALLPQLRLTYALLKATNRELEQLVPQMGKDAEIIDSLIGADVLTVAAFISEAPQAIKQRDLQALRHLSGSAPVTKSSGNSRGVKMRRACSPRLRDACFNMARTATVHDPYAKKLYESLHVGDRSAARAYRGVSDRLLTRLVACLRDGVVYSSTPPRTQVSAASSA